MEIKNQSKENRGVLGDHLQGVSVVIFRVEGHTQKQPRTYYAARCSAVQQWISSCRLLAATAKHKTSCKRKMSSHVVCDQMGRLTLDDARLLGGGSVVEITMVRQ